jgi:hypothetical protein
MNPRLEPVCIALEYLTLLLAVGWPTYRIAVTGQFWSSLVRIWFYLALWSVMASLVIPVVVTRVLHGKGNWFQFPEGRTCVMMICSGWIASLVFSVLALAIRKLWIGWSPQPSSQPAQTK